MQWEAESHALRLDNNFHQQSRVKGIDTELCIVLSYLFESAFQVVNVLLQVADFGFQFLLNFSHLGGAFFLIVQLLREILFQKN